VLLKPLTGRDHSPRPLLKKQVYFCRRWTRACGHLAFKANHRSSFLSSANAHYKLTISRENKPIDLSGYPVEPPGRCLTRKKEAESGGTATAKDFPLG
jgi:hypothetical protein